MALPLIVMVESKRCDELRYKLKHLAKEEPKVSHPQDLVDTTILRYVPAIDDHLFMREALQCGASSVSRIG